jgi:ATP:ADP antiporter, AAA family
MDVRPGESKTAFLLFLYFFLITFPAWIIKPVKISLFFISFSARTLPFAYLTTAVLIGFVVSLNARLLKKYPRRSYISLTTLFFIFSFILFWGLFKLDWRGTSLLYWFWSDVFIATTVTQFWICVNDVLHLHQTKRLVGFIVGGGLLGGIAGSLLAFWLARVIGTENLLLVCPALLVLTLAVVRRVVPDRGWEEEANKSDDPAGERIGYLEGFRLARKNRYLLLLAGLLGTAAVVGNLIDFQFSTILSWTYINKDPRTEFLAFFHAGLLVVSFFIQLLGTSRILRKFGVRSSLMATPVLLAAGSAMVFLVPVGSLIFWAVAIHGMDKSLENTLSQSVRELLYIPLAPNIKYKAKLFIDMFVNKLGAAVGALLLLLFYTILHIEIEHVSFMALAFLGLWIFLVVKIYVEYVAVFKKDLARKWEDGEKVVADHIDLDATRLVFDTIQSRDRSSVLYAMNLFDLIRKDKMTPGLREILADKAGELSARSMDSLLDAGGETMYPGLHDDLADRGMETDISEVFELESYRKVMGDHLDKISHVRGAAEIEKMEAAKVLGLMPPGPRTTRLLGRLLKDRSPDVLNYALAGAGIFKKKEHVRLIIPHLANPLTREVAIEALSAFGGRILGTLVSRLKDHREPPSVRAAIPDVLARLGTQRAVDALVAELEDESDETEPEVIGALYRIRASNPRIVFRKKRIVPAVLAQIRAGYGIVLEKKSGEPSEGRLASRIKAIFDLLSLICPVEDIVKAYQNLSQGTKRSIDFSLELLDNIVGKDLKEYLSPLIEDLLPEEKARRCRKLLATLDKKNRRRDLKRGAALR